MTGNPLTEDDIGEAFMSGALPKILDQLTVEITRALTMTPGGKLDVFEIHEFHWALCENAARGWCVLTARDFETSIDKASGRKSFVWRGVRVLARMPAPVNKVAS